MTKTLITTFFISSISFSKAAIILTTIEGTYESSSSSGFANENFVAQFIYDTTIPEDELIVQPWGTFASYYTAISSASITVGSNVYIGVNGPVDEVSGNPVAPAGAVLFVSNRPSSDRLEFRGDFYLNGDTNSQLLDLFEIVIEDQDSALLNGVDLPTTLDLNKAETVLAATFIDRSQVDNINITSFNLSNVPEPSSTMLSLLGSSLLLGYRSRKH